MDEPTQKFPDAYQTDKVASDDDISGHGITWSDQEEKKLVRKQVFVFRYSLHLR